MPIIARVKYPPDHECRATSSSFDRLPYLKIEDWYLKPDGTWCKTKVICFVKMRETALAMAELLNLLADRMETCEKIKGKEELEYPLQECDKLGLPSRWVSDKPPHIR